MAKLDDFFVEPNDVERDESSSVTLTCISGDIFYFKWNQEYVNLPWFTVIYQKFSKEFYSTRHLMD